MFPLIAQREEEAKENPEKQIVNPSAKEKIL
jgi:hypothetical protein